MTKFAWKFYSENLSRILICPLCITKCDYIWLWNVKHYTAGPLFQIFKHRLSSSIYKIPWHALLEKRIILIQKKNSFHCFIVTWNKSCNHTGVLTCVRNYFIAKQVTLHCPFTNDRPTSSISLLLLFNSHHLFQTKKLQIADIFLFLYKINVLEQ